MLSYSPKLRKSTHGGCSILCVVFTLYSMHKSQDCSCLESIHQEELGGWSWRVVGHPILEGSKTTPAAVDSYSLPQNFALSAHSSVIPGAVILRHE